MEFDEAERELFEAFMQGKTQSQMMAVFKEARGDIAGRMQKLREKVGAGGDNNALTIYGALYFLTPQQRSIWLGEHVTEAFLRAIANFTDRKVELMRLLASRPAITIEQIAAKWYVSSETVKTHLRQIHEPCGLSGNGARLRLAVLCKLHKDGMLTPKR